MWGTKRKIWNIFYSYFLRHISLQISTTFTRFCFNKPARYNKPWKVFTLTQLFAWCVNFNPRTVTVSWWFLHLCELISSLKFGQRKQLSSCTYWLVCFGCTLFPANCITVFLAEGRPVRLGSLMEHRRQFLPFIIKLISLSPSLWTAPVVLLLWHTFAFVSYYSFSVTLTTVTTKNFCLNCVTS
jgi:hypothetical protein